MGQLAAGAGAQTWSRLIAMETVGAKITEGRWAADCQEPGGVMMQWVQVDWQVGLSCRELWR